MKFEFFYLTKYPPLTLPAYLYGYSTEDHGLISKSIFEITQSKYWAVLDSCITGNRTPLLILSRDERMYYSALLNNQHRLIERKLEWMSVKYHYDTNWTEQAKRMDYLQLLQITG